MPASTSPVVKRDRAFVCRAAVNVIQLQGTAPWSEKGIAYSFPFHQKCVNDRFVPRYTRTRAFDIVAVLSTSDIEKLITPTGWTRQRIVECRRWRAVRFNQTVLPSSSP